VARYALVSNAAYREMRRHLPGPYTFILPATHEVPKMLISKQRTVGIRIPDHELCLEIVRRFGKPIISTSLNSSERTFASDPMEFIDFYDSKVDLIILAGPSYRDVSSVIDFTGEHPLVLREGQGDVSWCFA
jgi:tRNA threonylcarbamoyl adenosine modification protein (Sua5/YciO/YrdC/YwlC family)